MTDTERKRAEESKAKENAKRSGKAVTFISEVDGCEVTVTVDGNVFYNACDWY